MLKQFFCRRYALFVLPLLMISILTSSVFADESALGLSPEQMADIENKVKPVLKGKPVTELPDEDRSLLFLAEGLFPDSFDLFFRHGEYLATEKRDFTQAIPRLKKALEIKPKDLATLETLAICHTELKNAAEEVSCWETLRELLEDDDTSATFDLRERVTLNLERMAQENEMIMRQGRRFIIYTPTASEYAYVPNELSDERLEEIYLQVTGDLECIPAFRTSIIVFDPVKFDAIKPASWAGGFASGGKSMTLKTESFPLSEKTTKLPARGIVLHEFSHNIVFIAGDGRCPVWLNEGLAVFAEHKDDTFTEFKPTIPSPEQIMSLAQLEKEFSDISKLSGGPRVDQAYQLAGLYARFIIQNFTMTAPRLILNTLKANESFEKALFEVCKLTTPNFEKRFRNWVIELADN